MRRMRNHNLNLSYLKAQKGNFTEELKASKDTKSQIDVLQSQIDVLQSQMGNFTEQLKESKDTKTKIEELQSQVGNLIQELEELKDTKTKIEDLQSQIDTLQNIELKKSKAIERLQDRFNFRTGELENLEITHRELKVLFGFIVSGLTLRAIKKRSGNLCPSRGVVEPQQRVPAERVGRTQLEQRV